MRPHLQAARIAGVALLAGAALPAHAAVITVGAGQDYATLGQAVSAASANDTIDITAGTYTNQVADITVPLTLQGVGGPVIFTATQQLSNDKGFLIIDANTTVSGLTFEHATADSSSNNGAGIRYQQGNLTVINSSFIANQDGILATPNNAGTGSVTISNSLFLDNGIASGAGSGYAHAIYANDVANLTVTNSNFQGTLVGHDIKSRAADSIITGNTLENGVTGTSSYAIDLPNGGNATITGNTIDKGPNTGNPTMIAYGEEGLIYAANTMQIDANSFVNTDPGTTFGINNSITDPTATNLTAACNAFDNVSNPTSGPVTLIGNVTGPSLPSCAAAYLPAVAEPPAAAALLPAVLALFSLRRRRAPLLRRSPAPAAGW